MSNKDTNNRKLYQNLPKEEIYIEPDANLSLKLMDASAELKDIMNLFLTAPQEILETLRDESKSCHPKKFWKKVLLHCGIPEERSSILALELKNLLE